jgi:hypothetical protein
MFDWMIRMAAWAAGFNDRQLQLIEASMPATRRLIDLVNKAQPLIQKFLPLVKEAEPLVNQALPMIKQATVELQSIAPALETVLVVIERHMAAGKTQSQSLAAIEHVLSSLSKSGGHTS